MSLLALLLVFPFAAPAPSSSASDSGAGLFSGTPDEWSQIQYDSAESENQLTHLKAVQRDNQLYLYVKGTHVTGAGVFYIDSDNDTSTGCPVSIWADSSGIEYKIEQGALYHCSAGVWTEVGPAEVQNSDTVVEAAVDIASLGLTESAKMKVGYDGGNSDILPEMGRLMYGVVKSVSSGGAGSSAIPYRSVQIDGNPADWAGLAPTAVSPDGLTTVTTSVYGDHLNVLIQGQIDSNEFVDGLWEFVLIDADRNPNTGNVSWAWSGTMGSDYAIQLGALYQASSDGGWSWDDTGTVFDYVRAGSGANKVIEWSLPFSALGISTGQSFHMTFLSNTQFVPGTTDDPVALTWTPEPNRIKVDGITDDWDGIDPLAVSPDGLTSVTAYVYGEDLSVLIRGQIDSNEFADGLWEFLLIDADRNPDTGSVSWAWPESLGSDYAVQLGALYQASSDGGWSWDDTGTVFEYERSGSGANKVIEWTLPLSALGIDPDQSFNMAFLSNTQSAPGTTEDPVTFQLAVDTGSLTVDGDDSDWIDIEPGAVVSENSTTELYAVQDETRLFTLIKGSNLNLNNVYFIDSDGDASTGISSGVWLHAGIDYKVEDSRLYQYHAGDGSWEEKGSVYTNVTGDTAEMYLYLDQIGATSPANMKLGFVGRGILSLPMSGDEMLSVQKMVDNERQPHTFYPREIFDVLNNPYMGWAPWSKDKDHPDGQPYAQSHSLVYAGISWRELEPVKGQFDWEGIEQKYQFDYWTSLGKKINIRIVLDLPTTDPSHKDIPDWLYDELASDGDPGTWYDTAEIGAGFSPNYNNGKLIEEHERMISALADRYNHDPRIAFIQLGSLGHWGEWHTWPAGSGVFPALSVSDQYVQQYVDHFTNKLIGMRKPFPLTKQLNLGLFNDVFGIKSSTNEWLGWIQDGWNGIGEFVDPGDDASQKQEESKMPDFWKYSFSGGEFANGDAPSWLTDDNIVETLRQVRESHTSWLGPSSPANVEADSSIQPNIDAMLKIMGYRFVLESIEHPSRVSAGDALNLSMVWRNKGVAPFYLDWPLKFALANANGDIVSSTITGMDGIDIREWLPGRTAETATLTIPQNVSAGNYTLLVSIVDPDTGQPAIRLAIDQRRNDGWYALDRVVIPNASGNGGGVTGNIDVGNDSSQETVVVNDPSVADGKITIVVEEKTHEVRLFANVQQISETRVVEIQGPDIAMGIPGEVIMQLLNQVPAGQQTQSFVSIALNKVSDEDKETWFSQESANVDLTMASHVYDLQLSVIDASGESVALNQFEQPVTLRLKVFADADKDVAGIYYIGDHGELEYMGGRLVGDEWIAEVHHFSKYAVLEYNKSYEDVDEQDSAADAIRILAAKHILFGVSDTEFAPERNITRAEFTALNVRMLELRATAGAYFTDVPARKWYADAVSAAYEAGLVSGRTADAFAPEDAVTREEAGMIVSNALRYLGKPVDPVIAGMMTGSQVSASETISRAEAAVIMKRLADLLN